MPPPEPSSPSPSTLVPFLTATSRSRRGSLASLKSYRGEVDKDALAQALDDIHTTASKSETLTSFHDYDGGPSKSATKELVSSGVTGLYDKLKRGFSASPYAESSKDVQRPKTSASKESGDAESTRSKDAGTKKSSGLGTTRDDTASLASTASVGHAAEISTLLSPIPASSRDKSPQLGDSVVAGRDFEQEPVSAIDSRPLNLRSSSPSRPAIANEPTADDVELAKSALRNGDQSTAASEALARVLSHHDAAIGDIPQAPGGSEDGDNTHFSANGTTVAPKSLGQQLRATNKASAFVDEGLLGAGEFGRPRLLRVGASHLPGYEPSRASSTDGGDSSSQATATERRGPKLDPSPNINIALQRQRSDMRPPPRPSEMRLDPTNQVPSHLRRRVISKAFWMKDENAKVCFYCGQPFSTFRRKHHCRTCGQIFDSKCMSLVSGRPFGQPGTIRLCKPCEDMIYGSDDDDSTIFTDDGASIFERSPMLGRRSFGAGEEDLHGKMDGFDDDGVEVTTPSIGIPASRRNRESKRRSAVIEFDAGPIIPRPASSHSLMSLARRPRSSSHRRFHSRSQALRGMRAPGDERVPFQPGSLEDASSRKGSLPAFHNDNIIDPDLAAFLSDEGSDDEEQSASIFATLGGSADGSHGNSGLLSSAMKKGRPRYPNTGASSARGHKDDEALNQATKHLPKLSRHRNPSISSMSFSRPSPRRTRSQNMSMLRMDPDSFERVHGSSPVMSHDVSRTRVVHSSALCGNDAPRVELNQASLNHLRTLLSQLLRDHSVAHAKLWEKALMPILLQCTDDVTPNVQFGDDMDIRHYIKLKKVPGGRPGDTAYVSGIVFSKNIALKSMARSISHPRLVIVTFAIEYARHHTHYMSLDPVLAQEHEYLRNLVDRIAQLRPQVLLVQRNVAGLALDMLQKAGITVAYNIKESVLAAVARVTRTTIIKSVDKLAIDPRHLGTCESFEIKTFVHEGSRKSYIYLSGCQPDLGCTIVLRGADTKSLRLITRLTEFMCYVAYNLKLETSLLGDELVNIPTHAVNQLQAPDLKHGSAVPGRGTMNIGMGFDHGESLLNDKLQAAGAEEPSKYEKLELAWKSRILSASPFVVFMEPYMLTQLRDSERRLTAYKTLRDQYAAADEEGDQDDNRDDNTFEMVRPEMVHAPPSKDQPKAVREYLHAVHEVQYEKTMHTYETQRKLMDTFTNGAIDPFDPFSHQTIVVLHSLISSITSAPCQGPDIMTIDFYSGYGQVDSQFEEDCTLGQCIESMCSAAGTQCNVCQKRLYDHTRQYVHGYGQVSLSVVKQHSKMKDHERSILMWSVCRICQSETTVIPMSDNTWKYSFAKYLELSFWSSHLHPRDSVCDHDIHKDFSRYFSFGDLAVRVVYDPVDIYDVVVPRATITWKVESDLTVKNEQFSHFTKRLDAFTDSIKKRLDSINVDTLDEKKSLEANEYLAELHDRAQQDHDELLRKLQQKYSDSRYYELVPLNRALRFMDEKALIWDDIFSDFERDYFPTETDIRKLASLQLKDMFLASQPAASTVASDASDTEDETPEKKPVINRAKSTPLTGAELKSEAAHDVLSSTVEEHRESLAEIGDVSSVIKNESEELLGSSLKRNVSPREEQERAVEMDEVRHLDLAVPVDSLEHASISPSNDMSEQQDSRPTSGGSQTVDEPFATQTKPIGAGLLQKIEQIRSSRGSGEAESAESSKIPRLADLQKKRDTSPQPVPLPPSAPSVPVPPPLLRAQSSPTTPRHSPNRSLDLKSEHSIDSVANGPPALETPTLEKRLGDKLGVGRLASKVGKVAPSLIPRSIPSKDDANSTRVSALARHFEQMSREFEKERLKERRQRALRSRQARANPLASSQPVVEVYRNATEAVGGASVDVARILKAEDPSLSSHSVNETATTDYSARGVERQQRAPLPHEATDSEVEVEMETGDAAHARSRSQDISDRSSTTATAPMSPTSVPDIELHPELPITEHRKNVWFDYLSDFWSKRSASGWLPLEYPLHATEHVFEDSDIIVREDEPSSIIALSLACADYVAKVQEFRSNPKKQSKQQSTPNLVPSGSAVEQSAQAQAIEDSLLSDTGTHMKYSFAHGPVKASCKIFYAESFDALRRRCGVADRFVESLSRCLKYDSKGGKTKSLFLKTLDNRFIIKSLQEVELKAFTKFAPDYFAFMGHTLFHGVPSVIAKMFGLFQVFIKNPATGMDFSYYLLVMENLFYERNPNRRFDLKGSMRNRKIESTGQPDEVLLDENLVETIFESPLFVREHARKLLQASVYNDTMWLCKQNVMDYSLMAGFDDERKELIVGIIDCIRTYTWDKKLESWIKDRGKNKPTITSPKDYRNRFRVSMMQYVLQVSHLCMGLRLRGC